MSYGRDPDRNSRAPGAIASRDNAHPRKARARQAAQARATTARDRMMRTMTLGPRGGISQLGAVNVGYQGGSGGTARLPTGIRFDVGTSPQPPVPGGGGIGPGAPTYTTKIGTVAAKYPGLRVISPTPPTRDPGPGHYPTTVDPTGGGSAPPPPPLPTENTKTPPRPRPSTTSPTGGGGGGTWTPPPPRPQTPLPELAPVEIPDVPVTSSGSIDGKTIAIVGAAALAAYLILRKKG